VYFEIDLMKERKKKTEHRIILIKKKHEESLKDKHYHNEWKIFLGLISYTLV
jgi:hypothetical protein